MVETCEFADTVKALSPVEARAVYQLAEYFSFIGSFIPDEEFSKLAIAPGTLTRLEPYRLLHHGSRNGSLSGDSGYAIDPVVVQIAKEHKLMELRSTVPQDTGWLRDDYRTIESGRLLWTLLVVAALIICGIGLYKAG